jgi:hypothetical protein
MTTDDSLRESHPRPTYLTLFFSPGGAPAVRNKTIVLHIRVDEKGQTDLGGTTIEAVDLSPTQLKAVTDGIQTWRFHPAVLDGCAVPSTMKMTVRQ